MKHHKTLIISTLVSASLIGGPALLQAQVANPNWGLSSPQVQAQQGAVANEPANFSSLPQKVQNTIRSQAGQTPITSVTQGTMGTPAYQVGFQQNGKLAILQMAPNGSVLNRGPQQTIQVHLTNPRQISFNQLPAAVQSTVARYGGTQTVGATYQGTWNGSVYQANLQNGQRVVVARDGSLLPSGTLNEAAGAPITTQPNIQYPAQTVPAQPQVAPVPGNVTTPTTGAGTMSFKDLPWTVQKPMLDQSGWASIPQVSQTTLQDGRTAYTATYQSGGRSYQITVDQNGNVISNQPIQ